MKSDSQRTFSLWQLVVIAPVVAAVLVYAAQRGTWGMLLGILALANAGAIVSAMKHRTWSHLLTILLLGGPTAILILFLNSELNGWVEPAEDGYYVIALRSDKCDSWQAAYMAVQHAYPRLYELQHGEGCSSLFQEWRGSGWWRIERKTSDDVSFQELADESQERLSTYLAANNVAGEFRICVVDSAGRMYVPKMMPPTRNDIR